MDNAATHSKFWDSFYEARLKGDYQLRNAEKFSLVVSELWNRPYIAAMRKLDVGCGSGIYAVHLGAYNPLWRKTWTGIDLSDNAVNVAAMAGLDAHKSDLFDYSSDKKFEVFLFLDSIEHVMTRPDAGACVRNLAAKRFIVIGNAPLYLTDHGAEVEVSIDKPNLQGFAKGCGCRFFRSKVYGVKGYPYTFFEFHNYPEPEHWMRYLPWDCVPSGEWEQL